MKTKAHMTESFKLNGQKHYVLTTQHKKYNLLQEIYVLHTKQKELMPK